MYKLALPRWAKEIQREIEPVVRIEGEKADLKYQVKDDARSYKDFKNTEPQYIDEYTERYKKHFKSRVDKGTSKLQKLKEVEKGLNTPGRVSRADRIADAVASLGLSRRDITSLGHGADTVAVLSAGKVPENITQPKGVYTTKFYKNIVEQKDFKSPETVRKPKDHFLERIKTRAHIPQSLGATDYGSKINATGGAEFQEYLPYEAKHSQRARTVKTVRNDTMGRKLRDLNDHAGNIRLDRDLKPKILDALLEGPRSIKVHNMSSKDIKLDARRLGSLATKGRNYSDFKLPNTKLEDTILTPKSIHESSIPKSSGSNPKPKVKFEVKIPTSSTTAKIPTKRNLLPYILGGLALAGGSYGAYKAFKKSNKKDKI